MPDCPQPLSAPELDALLGSVDPKLLAHLASTYAGEDIEPKLAPAALRFALVRWSLDRGGLGAAFLAELELLAVGRTQDVRREIVARSLGRASVHVSGPRPVRATFTRDRATVTMWCSAVNIRDPRGSTCMFLLAPLAVLEGQPPRLDDPTELFPDAPAVITVVVRNLAVDVARDLAVELAALDRAWGLAILAVPRDLQDWLLGYVCTFEDPAEGAASEATIRWVDTDADDSVWCHEVVTNAVPGPPAPFHAVMPVVSDNVAFRVEPDASETLNFTEARLRGFTCAGRRLDARPVWSLLAGGLLRRASWPQRTTWVVRRLVAGLPGGPTPRPTVAWRSPDLRFIDWLYAELNGLDAAQIREIALVIGIQLFAALLLWVGLAAAESAFLVTSYNPEYFARQVRIGLGTLLIAGVGIPALYGMRAGVLATWSAVVVGLAALGVCVHEGWQSTTVVASATAGALFGAVLFLGNPGPRASRGRIEAGGSLALASVVCIAGFGLTQQRGFRDHPVPIALVVTALLLALLYPVLRHHLPRAKQFGTIAKLYVASAAPLIALIWLGILWANDPRLSGLLEGAAFGGLASLLLFAFSPRIRHVSPTMHRLFWGLLFPLGVITALWSLSTLAPGLREHRWKDASVAFPAGLFAGALVAWMMFVLSRPLLAGKASA